MVIDPDREEVTRAADRGFIGLHGDASSEQILRVAGVQRAHSVIVSVGRDDTTVLIVLTVRALAGKVRIIASVAEPENVKIVRSGGADEIVSPSRFGGYLMADAVKTQGTIDFVSELLSYRGQCQLVEREARPEEVGRAARETEGTVIVEIRRGATPVRLLERSDAADRSRRSRDRHRRERRALNDRWSRREVPSPPGLARKEKAPQVRGRGH